MPTERYTDDDLIPIRYLNDLFFCERRAALHLNEQLWKHNQFTVEGIQSHQRVDRPHKETRPDCTTAFSLWLVSRRLGLIGKADVVEFHPSDAEDAEKDEEAAEPLGQCVPRQSRGTRLGVPFPIDYKRGRKRKWDRDDVQLCAQAFCLEEMLGVAVPAGAIFHVRSRQRREVAFDNSLRAKTEEAVVRLRELITSQVTPTAKYEKKCDGCSLKDLCMPKSLRPRATAARYLLQVIAQTDDEANSESEPLP
jgi:CRISPR-associated exonuclease Cas4